MNKLRKLGVTLCIWTSVSVFSNNDFSVQNISAKEHNNLLPLLETKKDEATTKNSPQKVEGKNKINSKVLPVKAKN